jgi:hypothetical protein
MQVDLQVLESAQMIEQVLLLPVFLRLEMYSGVSRMLRLIT